MRINTNIASLNAQTNAANTNKSLTSSLEKLSSGLAINKAADDASGMAIADKLRTQASSIGQGISNANSGSALIQIADKALGEQSSILDTVKTKLIQASTSTTSSEGREAIRKDISKLLEQFDNISQQTTYNGINLLNEKGADFSFQVGEKATDSISVTLERGVNTDSLGNAATIDANATADLKVTGQAGVHSVAIEADGDTSALTVKATAGGHVVVNASNLEEGMTTAADSDMSFSVDATKVESISLKGSAAAASVTIKTDDAAMQIILDAMVTTNTGVGTLTRVGEGNYTFAATAANTLATLTFAASADDGLDLNKLKFSGVATGAVDSTGGTADTVTSGAEVLSFETVEEVTITKTGGDKDLGIAAANTAGYATLSALTFGSDTAAKDMTYTTAVQLESGTTSLQIDPKNDRTDDLSVVDPTIAINTATVGALKDTDADFTVNSTEVKSIKMQATGAQGEMVLQTSNADLQDKLEVIANTNVNLTANDDGTFTFKATATSVEAAIDFGSEAVDISDLRFTGVQQSNTATSVETVYIETTEAVTVTNNKPSTDTPLTIDGSDGTTADAATAAAGTHVDLLGAETSKAVVSEKLNALTELEENGLTADKANQMMEVIDNALNQLNAVRSDFGSTQNQLEVATRSMMVTQVNIKAAESVIRDVDYAAESASFNKQNIIAQAGTYAMSQANAMAQNVQKLLQ